MSPTTRHDGHPRGAHEIGDDMPDSIPIMTAEEIHAAFTELANFDVDVDPDEFTETVLKLQANEYVDTGNIRELRAVLVRHFGLGEVLGAEAEHFLHHQPGVD